VQRACKAAMRKSMLFARYIVATALAVALASWRPDVFWHSISSPIFLDPANQSILIDSFCVVLVMSWFAPRCFILIVLSPIIFNSYFALAMKLVTVEFSIKLFLNALVLLDLNAILYFKGFNLSRLIKLNVLIASGIVLVFMQFLRISGFY
jgi:hypothetical protein